MSANQKPDFMPDPVSQRDGSRLANSNCRMASIATGLSYETLGAMTSTGAKMRGFTDDQTGGTDSGDARESWWRGYGQRLDIQDGNVWDDVLTDLRAYRMVHLDVWHATTGGCISGTGGYGHTVAVAPDFFNGSWMVADPWCSPPRWQRISEGKLRAGAEEWGRRLYAGVTSGPGRDWRRSPPTREELSFEAKLLMARFHAGGPEDFSDDPGDTGGAQRVMYTATVAHPPKEEDVALIDFTLAMDEQGGTITVGAAGAEVITVDGGERPALPAGTVRPALGPATLAIHGNTPHYLLFVGTDELGFVSATQAVFTPYAPSAAGDCGDEVNAAIAERDDEWETWLLLGSPGR